MRNALSGPHRQAPISIAIVAGMDDFLSTLAFGHRLRRLTALTESRHPARLP
jgi:hypothetical protein